ncbi:MAG: outer membrane beta-barrel protein, partial [Anaerolineales bacterium]
QLKFKTKLEYRDSVKLNLNSINLPVLVRVTTDNKKFQFTSGIELAYLYSARWNNGSEKINVRSQMDNFNISLVFGVGYIIPIKSTRLTLDVLYTQGIRNISASSADQSVLPRIKTKGFRLNILWTCPLQKTSLGQK